MLNFVYWPISAVLWFWHKVFSLVLNPDSGVSWVLAIMFLTFTIRAVLLKPTLNSMRSMSKMQEMQPAMAAIKQKHKGDQQKILEETRKLQKELGIKPAAGCLPMLVQMPVFIGLFHVLRSFNRTGTGPGQLGLSVAENRALPNYIFSPHDVQSFLDARFFNVPLSAYISMKQSMYDAFQPVNFTRTDIMIVTVPLIIIIAAATHFNGKASVARTKRRQAQGLSKAPDGAMAGQAEMMNKMMVWVFPFTILATGMFWHIGLLFYMMANNVWTYMQQHWLFKKLDAEEEAALEAKRASKRATAPKPGVRPNNPKKKGGVLQPAPEPQPEGPVMPAPEKDSPKGIFGGLKASFQQMKKDAEAQVEAQQQEKNSGARNKEQSVPPAPSPAPRPGQKPAPGKKKKKKK